MRLFIAFRFSERFLDALDELTGALCREAVRARPTLRDNHHLTLAFLGEQESAAPWREALEAAQGQATTLVTAGLGCFSRPGGDIWWLGLQREPKLERLHDSLNAALAAAGFRPERRPFRPHLTLLREARMPEGFDAAACGARLLPYALHERCDRLSLMRSQRLDGRLVYSELYGKQLPNA